MIINNITVIFNEFIGNFCILFNIWFSQKNATTSKAFRGTSVKCQCIKWVIPISRTSKANFYDYFILTRLKVKWWIKNYWHFSLNQSFTDALSTSALAMFWDLNIFDKIMAQPSVFVRNRKTHSLFFLNKCTLHRIAGFLIFFTFMDFESKL